MKKALLLSLIGLFLWVMPSLAEGGKNLVPEQCDIENRLVYWPISEVGLTFDGAIALKKDVRAVIYRGDEAVGTGTITVSNYEGTNRIQGTAIIAFGGLTLPKGQEYRLEIPAGAICKKSDSSVETELISAVFTVPANLGEVMPSVQNGGRVAKSEELCFYYKTEIERLGNSTMILYREGVPVRNLNIYATWDWDLGQVYIDMEKNLKFERNVNFSLLLPKESVSSIYRSDITNDEVRLDFVGGYEGTMEPLTYVDWVLGDNSNPDLLGVMFFFYDRPIMLSPNSKILLRDVETQSLVKEVTPTLGESGDMWNMLVDFGNIKIPEKGFSVIIPEGTVISADDDIVVNATNVVRVGSSTGVGYEFADGIKVTGEAKRIIIENAVKGEPYAVFSTDGKKIVGSRIDSGRVVVELGSKGVYLVFVNGKSYKVAL